MSTNRSLDLDAFLSVPGAAADHLYREGSAHASFWEAVFGSSLRAKKRARVSTLADGTRMFEVPLLGTEDDILRTAQSWMSSPDNPASCKAAALAIATKSVRVRLIGLQPQGQAIARFALRFEPSAQAPRDASAITEGLRSWFEAEGRRIAEETLIPFGFTPHPA